MNSPATTSVPGTDSRRIQIDAENPSHLGVLETPEQRADAADKRIGALYVQREGTNQLLTEILTELRHIRSALAASGSVSSVQLEQDSKGQVKLTVKAYESSDVELAGTAAVEEFGRLFREVERRSMAQWAETVEALS